jgi:hypothetical protein
MDKTTWYERNSLEVKLLQFLIYHLKKEGVVIVPSKKKETKPLVVDSEPDPAIFVVSFD